MDNQQIPKADSEFQKIARKNAMTTQKEINNEKTLWVYTKS